MRWQEFYETFCMFCHSPAYYGIKGFWPNYQVILVESHHCVWYAYIQESDINTRIEANFR